MRIDVHAHYWTDDYLDQVAAMGRTDTGTQRGIGAGGGAELERRLALMDASGLDMQVLSASPQLPYGRDRDAAVAAARFVNDQYADVVARHPGRFAAFAALPLPHVEESLAELERALTQLGMVGVAMTTTLFDRALVDSPAAELFAELDHLETVLYLHPAGNAACSPLVAGFGGRWMIGAPMEDTISAQHLITRGIPLKFPRLRILNSHLGGGLPMFVKRMDDHQRWEAPGTPEPPSVAARRMWYDTVSHVHPPALRCAVESFGADRIVLGTDFPYEDGERFEEAVRYPATAGLSADDTTRILSTNAQELLRLHV